MPRTGIWVRPETGEWGILKPLSEKAKRIQAMCDSEPKCDHLWVAGGLVSDWICEHCGERRDIE